jgi:hypothetical protein
MPASPRAAKKGRSPLFWVALGCCGCLLLVGVLAGVIGGGVYMATKPVASATQTWIGEVRANNMEAAVAGLSTGYRDRLTQEEMVAIATAIQGTTDATFPSRSIDNDRAVVKGVLTGGAAPQPITVTLVKEEGSWKVDNVELGVE